jgi:hypothetical protein
LIAAVAGDTFGLDRDRVARTLFPQTIPGNRLPRLVA